MFTSFLLFQDAYILNSWLFNVFLTLFQVYWHQVKSILPWIQRSTRLLLLMRSGFSHSSCPTSCGKLLVVVKWSSGVAFQSAGKGCSWQGSNVAPPGAGSSAFCSCMGRGRWIQAIVSSLGLHSGVWRQFFFLFVHSHLKKVGVTRLCYNVVIVNLLYVILILHLTKHCHRFLARVAFFHSHAAFLKGEFSTHLVPLCFSLSLFYKRNTYLPVWVYGGVVFLIGMI